MTAPALDCRGVCLRYGPISVLEDVSFALAPAERAVVLGPNGAGKSSLIRVLTGLLTPAAGEVRLFGEPVAGLAPARRAAWLAVVPQELVTPAPLTVGELVAIGRLGAAAGWARATARDHAAVERAMACTDVLSLRDRPLDALSGGERQRAALALALAREPRVLLLDEPTAHLDINHRLEWLGLLERLNREQGLTVLMTSHDLGLAAEFFPRILLMRAGRIVADGPPGASAHVICGGGSGMDVLRRLYLDGWTVTAGALNDGDSDTQTARAFGIPVAIERPFSPLGVEALAAARAMALAATVTIVCPVAFGGGNVRNLEIALDARRAGRRVLLNLEGASARDFTSDGRARGLLAELQAAGAKLWRQPSDLFERLISDVGGT